MPQGRDQPGDLLWERKCDRLLPTEMRRLKQLEFDRSTYHYEFHRSGQAALETRIRESAMPAFATATVEFTSVVVACAADIGMKDRRLLDDARAAREVPNLRGECANAAQRHQQMASEPGYPLPHAKPQWSQTAREAFMIALNDGKLDVVIDAVKPIPARDRDQFLRDSASELTKHALPTATILQASPMGFAGSQFDSILATI